MKHKELDRRIKECLSNYKNDVLKIENSGTHNGEFGEYVLPEGIEKNFIGNSYLLFTKYFDKNITNIYSNHLCSSQVMCMNFFLPLVDDKDLLNKIVGIILGKDEKLINIKTIDFNFPLAVDIKGSVDLFIETEDEERLYIQTNYIESSFGEFFDNQKTSAWEKTYSSFTKNSLYLKNMDKDEFYKEYGLNKKIGLIKDKKDYAIFIYPFENDSLKNILDENSMKNVVKIDWNELTYKILNIVKGDELEDHYREFSRKYLNY